jgi:hypothetical protein
METNENHNKPAAEPELYPLDDAMQGMIGELRQHESQVQGALVLFIRQHKLQGNWQIAQNGRELVKAQQQVFNPTGPRGE